MEGAQRHRQQRQRDDLFVHAEGRGADRRLRHRAGNVEITGKVVESSVSWVFKSAYNGGPITLTYKGSLGTDGQLAGAVTVEEFSVTGDFTATPIKK